MTSTCATSMDSSTSTTILMVDDRPENLLALEAILQGLGHRLLRAGSGEEALKQLLSQDVALILLDVQMPGMDGFETAAHIKQRERTRDVPIVFLTAIDGEAHQAFRGYAAGAVDYLSKPFDPWVLRAKVGVFVELHDRRRQLAEQAEQLERQRQRLDAPRLSALAARVERALTLELPVDGERPAGVGEALQAIRELQGALTVDRRRPLSAASTPLTRR